MNAIKARHSVRAYLDKPLSEEHIGRLRMMTEEYSRESGLSFQLILDEPKAFDCRMAHYGKFSNVKNYIAIIGKKTSENEEKCGYYGEKLVLNAQLMGLNTCWVASTYKTIPEVLDVQKGEKLIIVIAVGYGESKGAQHKSKELKAVSKQTEKLPKWYQNGVEAALLAPTAINQQKFKFSLNDDGTVSVKTGFGPCIKIDLGIVKLHFEIGSGRGRQLVWNN